MKVLIVGSAEESRGGVATVIRTMKQMAVWRECGCRWLGTQIQRNYLWKAWYAVRAWCTALIIVWRYDVVHFHTVPDRIGLLIQLPVLLLAIVGRKRIIMHIHMGNQLTRHTRNRLFKWCLRRADRIVLLARRWEELFRREFSDVHVPTTVIHNACAEVAEASLQEKERSIVMAAYFNDNKAPDLLLKAWKELHAKYPDWRITMMGNGEVERFRRMSCDMGLQGSVTFTGYLTGRERDEVLRRASILCICSYEEGFPMVALEAWAWGACLITTPVGGLPEVLEDGRNCLTFPFGSSHALAARLEQLISDAALCRTMTEYSRAFVSEHFSPRAVNAELTKLYAEDID